MTDVRISAAEFKFVKDLVRRRSAIVLEAGKEYLVETRLLPVARAAGEDNVPRLLSLLRTRHRPRRCSPPSWRR